MRAALIVAVEIGVENRLHLLDRLEPGAASFDSEMLVQQGAVQSLDDAVGLRARDPSRAMLDLLELQEQLVRMLVGPPAELAAVVGQHAVDRGAVGLEGRDDVVVHQVDGGDRQLARLEPRPGVAAVAVDHGLQIELADALKGADEKRVDRDQGPGVGRLDVALAELGRESAPAAWSALG